MKTHPTKAEPYVLVVEDDPKIAQVLVDYLHADGLRTQQVADGAIAVHMVQQRMPAVMVLDLMLPGLDGISVCRSVRAFSDVPIIMLTARVDEIDRMLGLDSGADDYVCKPFSPKEVVARVKAQLRRANGHLAAQPPLWKLDEQALRIEWRGQALALTPVEFRLFRQLLGQPGRVFSRAQLLDNLHDELRDVSDRAVDSHIKNLRRKLQTADAHCDCIESIYGLGYRFEVPR